MSSANSQNNENMKKAIEVVDGNDVPFYYYDMLNVVAGASEVVLEFGNNVRGSDKAQMKLAHRAVLSIPAAFKLQQGLAKTLQMLQEKLQHLQQEAINKQNAEKQGNNE